jgi:tripartite ATP-independent transporter DctP family solute receptor
MPADSAVHAAAIKFAMEVESKSLGTVHVSVHPAEQLGTDLQMLEQAREGGLDLLLIPTAKLSSDIPEMQYADLPFYFASPEEHYAMLDGEPGQMLLGKTRAIGLVGVSFWTNGQKHFTGRQPLHRPEDFNKLRFRVMKSRLIMEQFQALRATPVPIEFSAVYRALADGAVDGQENPLAAIVGMGFHKVQSHLTLSGHAYIDYVFSISGKTYEKLPPDVRELLTRTARELSPWQRAETLRRDAGFLQQVKAAGVEVHELTSTDRAAFAKAIAPVVRSFEPVVGADLMAKTEEIRYRSQSAAELGRTLLIGLDADLSSDGASVGMDVRRGIELAINEINARGGVLGRRLQLLARDHRGISSESRKNLQAFAAMPELLAVVGGKTSSIIIQDLDLIHEHAIPYLVPWAAASDVTRNGRQPNYVFRVSVTDQDVAPFLMDKASKGGRQVAMVLESSVWGRSAEAAVADWVKQGGKPPVKTLWFNRGDADFSGAMLELERSGAQAVMLVGNAVEGAAFAKAMAARASPLPVYSHWGVIGGEFSANAAQALERLKWYTVSTAVIHPEPDRASALGRLLAQYETFYDVEHDEQTMHAFMGVTHAYDLVYLLKRAVERSGSADRVALRDALEHLAPWRGVVRNYERAFTPQRHDALDASNLKLVRMNKRGHWERPND